METIKQLTPEQVQRIKDAEDRIEKAKNDLLKVKREIYNELKLGEEENILVFLTLETRGGLRKPKESHVRLAWITRWSVNTWGAQPTFRCVSADGKPGNEISCYGYTNVAYEPTGLSLEESKRRLNEIKKEVKKEKGNG